MSASISEILLQVLSQPFENVKAHLVPCATLKSSCDVLNCSANPALRRGINCFTQMLFPSFCLEKTAWIAKDMAVRLFRCL